MRLGRHPDSEVHVWLGMLDLSAGPDGPYALAFGNLGADPDADGPQMDERDRVPVHRANRHAEPRVWQRSGERDHTARGRAHVDTRDRPDVHTTVLAALVRIVLGQKPAQDRPVDRPAPGAARRRERERSRHREQHHPCSVANFENHEPAR